MDCDFFIQASKIENQKRTGVITYEESKIYLNALNKCTLAQVRDDIARNIIRGRASTTPNNQPPLAKSNVSTRPRNNLGSRSSSVLSLNNRFQPLDMFNNDLGSIDSVNTIPSENENDDQDVVGWNGNAKIYKSKRRFDSYAHSLKSSLFEPVSDDSFNFDPSTEVLKEPVTVNHRQRKTNPVTLNFRQSKSNLDKDRVPESSKNVNGLADFFSNGIKDSFLYQLMNKIRTFYKLPNKTGFQWFHFLSSYLILLVVITKTSNNGYHKFNK